MSKHLRTTSKQNIYCLVYAGHCSKSHRTNGKDHYFKWLQFLQLQHNDLKMQSPDKNQQNILMDLFFNILLLLTGHLGKYPTSRLNLNRSEMQIHFLHRHIKSPTPYLILQEKMLKSFVVLVFWKQMSTQNGGLNAFFALRRTEEFGSLLICVSSISAWYGNPSTFP